ncbi:hypothetical protein L3X38_029166 [Prunus dulcis]|uniref:Uncharacterized protein n=1 Tax=Prunus dulcis TaxID=3755 RepID=A0AAD4Z258_PRUDU|nr:hypothetical protein L3X38_029166 [Prunus dulcis]
MMMSTSFTRSRHRLLTLPSPEAAIKGTAHTDDKTPSRQDKTAPIPDRKATSPTETEDTCHLDLEDLLALNVRVLRDGFSYGQRPTAVGFYDDDGLGVQNVKEKFGHSWQLANNYREFVDTNLPERTVRPVSVTPNMFVPAPNSRRAFYFYYKALRGQRRRYITMPGPAHQQPVGCYRITLG